MYNTSPNLPGDRHDRISVLAITTTERAAELERMISHTRWQMQVVHTVQDALHTLRASPVCVVLCDRHLPDGTWLDLMHAAEQLYPRPEVIVISPSVDLELWDEIFHCGGYDLLTTPLEPQMIYEIVPMAWRKSKRCREAVRTSAAHSKSKCTTANAG